MNSHSEQLIGVLLCCHSLWKYTVYQFLISTQLLGRQKSTQKISGRGSSRMMEKGEIKGKRISREKYLSNFCFVSGNIDLSIYAVKLLFNIITIL